MSAHLSANAFSFRLDIGDKPTIFLCSFEAALEASKKDVFMAKPYESDNPFVAPARGVDSYGNLSGIFCNNGLKNW